MPNFRGGNLALGQPLGLNVTTALLTADNQAVSVVTPTLNYSWLQLSSDNTTATARTFTLATSTLVGHTVFIEFVSGSSTTCQLVNTGTMKLSADWTPTQYQTLTLVSDGTNWIEQARAPGPGASSVAAGSIVLASLAAGITPSHVVKYAAQYTTVGGAASEAISVPGVLSTDLVWAQLKVAGGTPRTILTAAATNDTVTVVFSGNPSTDHVIYYQVLRAAT